MATAERKQDTFVIDSKADRLLSELSRELSDVILQIASAKTVNKTKDGVPIVDTCDISAASSFLCEALRAASESGQLIAGGHEALDSLLQFCNVATRECNGADAK